MALLSQLRAVGASAVALAVATGAGVAFTLPGNATTEVAIAVPAASVTPDATQQQARELLISSRNAERDALADEVSQAAQARLASMSSTGQAIEKTESVLETQRAAAKAAQDKAAAAKAAADQAAKDQAAKDKAAADKVSAAKASPAPSTAPTTPATDKATAKPSDADAKKLGSPSKAQNKETARQLALSLYGWGDDQFTCFDNIIMRESVWDQFAANPSSSAYGIPQALPGSKMASEGADWKTNPATQIKWGLKYIKERYGTPCQAWSFKSAKGWY